MGNSLQVAFSKVWYDSFSGPRGSDGMGMSMDWQTGNGAHIGSTPESAIRTLAAVLPLADPTALI